MTQKQAIAINFSQGVDTKTDPFQVELGKFLNLENSVFNISGELTKRNGYKMMTSLPDSSSSYLTTYNGNLTAIGNKLEAYSAGSETWVNKGNILPVDVLTLPLVRNNTSQIQADSATAANGLVCVGYTDQNPANLSADLPKYAVYDSVTGQNVIAPTVLPSGSAAYPSSRVFVLGAFFIILYTTLITGSSNLEYIAISTMNPAQVSGPFTIASTYSPQTGVAFDALSLNDRLFIAYNTASGGQTVKVTYITPILNAPVSARVYSGAEGDLFSIAADLTLPSNPILYISYFTISSTTLTTSVLDQNLNVILAPTSVDTSDLILNITSFAQNGAVEIYSEVSNDYGYDSSIPTHYISKNSVTESGTVGTASIVARSVGLASKAFILNGVTYFLAVYDSVFQPGYYLLNQLGQVIAKLAYTNAYGYYTLGLPNVTLVDNVAQIPYLIKDLIQAVNKTQGVANAAGVYSQTGVNLASLEIGPQSILSAEIGNNLNLTGGYLAMYDGVTPVEQGFFVYPDSVETTPDTSGGSMPAQTYFYQVTYEWADNQGNIFRSSPSIPVTAVLSATGEVTLDIPTLRLTYKLANPVRIVIYRWSTTQPIYFRTTSISLPLLNDPTVDFLTYVDTLPDSAIAGNDIIYTTGGVIENISPPATNNICLFNYRLFLVDAEDRNLLWFSKQVIEDTPVEMSDLLTLFVSPTTASEGSTGPITAISPMDDKLIIFKENALGYINGIGPDNTGANSQYSDFVLINSVVGCIDQQSIVFTPAGLIFQSNKGIWLLGRDLSTSYVGAPVQSFTQSSVVLSSLNVPATNEVRFTLDSGLTLLYDYYYGQWGTFTGIPAVSSTIYKNLHTFINSLGQVFQETPGLFLDGSTPVVMSFTTSWLHLAGLQGYQRGYWFYLLGKYISPHKLVVQVAFDYNPAIAQQDVISPNNYSPYYGQDLNFGSGTPYGGVSNRLQWRIFLTQQRTESFQITVNEVYDPSFGIPASQGLSLSGINLVIGVKKGYRPMKASESVG
jgi:hypothetical protein